MANFDLTRNNSALVDDTAQVIPMAIGLLVEREFNRARTVIPDLLGFPSYEDWLDAREGLQVGLSMAGIDAPMVRVGLTSFLEWSDLTGVRYDERAFDAFAASVLTVRRARGLRVLAVVSEFDFARYARGGDILAGHSDYQSWTRHRRQSRAVALGAGMQVEELPVRLGTFVEWCSCLGLSACEAALDRYAQLLLEHLASETVEAA